MMALMCFLALLNGVRAVAGPDSESGVFRVGSVGSEGLSTGLTRASANRTGAHAGRHMQAGTGGPGALSPVHKGAKVIESSH